MLLVTTPIALQIASLLSALDVTPIKICETDIGSDTGIAAVSLVLCNPHCRVDKKGGDEAYKNCHIVNKFRNNENKKIQLYELILS